MNTEVMEKLDKIYWCQQCNSVFLFKSDVQEHGENLGHLKIAEFPLK